MLIFRPLIKDFLESAAAKFEIVYLTPTPPLSQKPRRLLVLDSSFNPPHLGHLALVQESLAHEYRNELVPLNQPTSKTASDAASVLLLLSLENADKGATQLDSALHRIDMMKIVADHLQKIHQVDVNIGVIKAPRFVDKSLILFNYLHAHSVDHPKLTFLVGFDTLTRILDPKYYIPDKLSSSLQEFMFNCDLFVLTRGVGGVAQSKYVDDISHGRIGEIPTHWSNSIHMINDKHGDSALGVISSTLIRNNIIEGGEEWHSKVLPDIREYIEKEHIYK